MLKKVISIIVVISMLSASILPIMSSLAVENVNLWSELNTAPIGTGAATWVEGPDRVITVHATHSTGISQISYQIDNDSLVNLSGNTFSIPKKYFDYEYHELYVIAYAKNGEANSIIYQFIGPDLSEPNDDPIENPEVILFVKGYANNVELSGSKNNYLNSNDKLSMIATTNKDIRNLSYTFDNGTFTALNNFYDDFEIPSKCCDGNIHTVTMRATTTDSLVTNMTYNFYTDKPIVDEDTWLILRAKANNIPLVNGDPNLLEKNDVFSIVAQTNGNVKLVSYAFDGGNYVALNNVSSTFTMPNSCCDGNYHTLTIKGETTDGVIEFLTYRIIVLVEDVDTTPIVTVSTDNKIMNQTDTYLLEEDQNFVVNANSTADIKRIEYRFMQETTTNVYSDVATVDIPEKYRDGGTYSFSVRAEAKDGESSYWQTYLFRYNKYNNLEYPIIVLPDEKLDTQIDNLIVALRTIPITTKTGNQNYFKVGENIQYNIDFANGGNKITNQVVIDFVIPSQFDVTFIDTKGGKVIDSNTIRWTFNGLDADENGTIPIILKFDDISNSANIVKPYTKIYSGSLSDYSAVVNYIFKDTTTKVTTAHEAFMIGDEYTGLFRPNDGINRAEVATVLVRIFDLQLISGYANNYADANKIKNDYGWAEKAIMTVTNYGLMEGYNDGEFKPENKVTKAQLITILARKFAVDGGTSTKDNPFAVKQLPLKWFNNLSMVYNSYGYDSHWAATYLAQMIRLNMLPEFKNTIDGNLDLVISRAEVARLISHVLLRGPSVDGANGNLTRNFPDVNENTPYYEYILEASAYTHNSKFKTNGWETMVK